MEVDPQKYDFSVDGYIETCKGMDKETFNAYTQRLMRELKKIRQVCMLCDVPKVDRLYEFAHKALFPAYYNVTPIDSEDVDYHRMVALKDGIRRDGVHRRTGPSGTRRSHQ